MKWDINIQKEALEFIKDAHIEEDVILILSAKAINKLSGQSQENIDLKKLKGEWSGFYCIRKGKLRVIFKIDFDLHILEIFKIDYRGSIY